jgi:hypothetical protein
MMNSVRWDDCAARTIVATRRAFHSTPRARAAMSDGGRTVAVCVHPSDVKRNSSSPPPWCRPRPAARTLSLGAAAPP